MPRVQRVLGAEFFYQPPPKSTVPYAASLKGTHISLPGQRCAGGVLRLPQGPSARAA